MRDIAVASLQYALAFLFIAIGVGAFVFWLYRVGS